MCKLSVKQNSLAIVPTRYNSFTDAAGSFRLALGRSEQWSPHLSQAPPLLPIVTKGGCLWTTP